MWEKLGFDKYLRKVSSQATGTKADAGLMALELELGQNAKGDFATVAARLDALTYGSSARAYRSAALNHTASGSWQKVAVDTKTGTGGWDVLGEMDVVTNNRFTAKKAGKYGVAYGAAFATNATGMRHVGIQVNGAFASLGTRTPAISGFESVVAGADILNLVVGDYVELLAYQNSGGTLAYSTAIYTNFMAIHRIG